MTMKRLLYLAIIAISVIAAWHAPAGPITKGYTFSTNEQVTAAKLHSLVDDAAVSGLTGANITDGSIAAVDLGVSSVITAKIQDSAVTAGKLGALAVETAKIATNAVGTAQLATNIDLSAKVLTLATNQIPGISIASTNAGPGTAGQVPLLGADGLVSSSLIPSFGASLVSTNLMIAVSHGTPYTWTNIATLSTTTTSGCVVVSGRVTALTAATYSYVRVRDSATNGVSVAARTGANTGNETHTATLVDVLSGTTKTYVLEVASSSASSVYTNINANGSSQTPPMDDGLGLKILQIK